MIFWQLRIMSDALEYGNSSEEVKSQLSANFDNHYKLKKGVKMELKDTIPQMNSEDYKERFKAEYNQTKIRYWKLHTMIVKYEAGTLTFEPTCPIDLLKEQASHMGDYLYTLEIRAEIEGIELS